VRVLKSFGKTLIILGKWILISAVTGFVVGGASSLFSYLVMVSTSFREAHPYIVFGLPAAGLLIVFLYRRAGAEMSDTNSVIEAVRTEKTVALRVAPLIFLSTILTHLFGGSAGREGAALQFGGSIGSFTARRLHMDDSDTTILMMAAMSAAFSALFGTPLAAAVLPMEFVSIGVLYYAALVPCVLSSFIAQSVAVYFHIHGLQAPYELLDVQSIYSIAFLKIIAVGIACALVGILFCNMLVHTGRYAKKWFVNPYVRILIGGGSVVLLSLLLRTQDYLGLGAETIKASFSGDVRPEAFLLKMVFTCLTLCFGFKGGEIVPSLFIGATMGSALSGLLGLPADLCAACGMCGVFCAVTNSPITSLLIAFELFGFKGAAFFSIVVAVSYMLSGYYSVFGSQKIMYSKTRTQFINKESREAFSDHLPAAGSIFSSPRLLVGKELHEKIHQTDQDKGHEEDAEHSQSHDS
jgi:H+/Cl- antiporter ClcA